MITLIHHDNDGCVTVFQDAEPAGIVADCYARAWTKPNYPMPALEDNAETATNWLHLALCPLYYEGNQDTPCDVCIDRFLDGLE